MPGQAERDQVLEGRPRPCPLEWWPHEEVGHNDESKKEMLALAPDHESFERTPSLGGVVSDSAYQPEKDPRSPLTQVCA